MNWLIVRTDFRKEQAVAIQIAKKGYDVWVPLQILSKRAPGARRHMDRSNVRIPVNRPVCPSLLFAAVPLDSVERILGIRHLTRLEQTSENTWALVPDNQVQAFKEAIDALNKATQMLTLAAHRQQKKRWKSLQDGLLELVAAVTSPIEEAA